MIIRGAKNLDSSLVLQLPEQIAAFDDAVDALLEIGARQGFKQGSGKREMNTCEVFETPEGAGDAIQSPEDLAGFPFIVIQEGFQVAGGLVQVKDQGMKYASH